MDTGGKVSFLDVSEANERISPYVHKTPILTCHQADDKSGRKLFFKAENLQKAGSFKARGALNAVAVAKERDEIVNGVVTHSSGNHGQALAWAAKKCGVPCHVIVKASAPAVKKRAILGFGGEVIECGPRAADRYEMCEKVQKEKGLLYVPSSDHLDIIAGQGTIGLELLDQVPDLDGVFVPVSGGGLAAGIALTVKTLKPDVKVFLVTPKDKMLEDCLRTGKRPWNGPQQYLNTVADGIILQQTGYTTTPIIIQYAEKEVFEMGDEEIIEAMKFSFERMKLVIEGASAAAVAAVFSDKFAKMDPDIQNVAVILSGGNVDIDHLPWLKSL